MQPDKPDLKTMVIEHPFASLAIGFVAGAGVAVITRPRTLLGRALVAITGGVVRSIAIDRATRYATTAAASWLATRDKAAPNSVGVS